MIDAKKKFFYPMLPLVNNQPRLTLILHYSHGLDGDMLSGEIRSLFVWGRAAQSKNEPKKMIVLEWLFLTIAPCDAVELWQLGSRDAATPMMQGIIDLHHDIFFFPILILVFVSSILVHTLWHFHYKKISISQRTIHGITIEILWTIFPSTIPMFIAIPSIALLYSMDEVVVGSTISIKAIGYQWYWSAPLHEGNLSATKTLTLNMICKAFGLLVISYSHSQDTLITIACQKWEVEMV